MDKLWSGVMDKSRDISVDNVSAVFRTLPCLKQVIKQLYLFKMIACKLDKCHALLESWCSFETAGVKGWRLLEALLNSRCSGGLKISNNDSIWKL